MQQRTNIVVNFFLKFSSAITQVYTNHISDASFLSPHCASSCYSILYWNTSVSMPPSSQLIMSRMENAMLSAMKTKNAVSEVCTLSVWSGCRKSSQSHKSP